jgi:hypothetical protein
MAHRAFSSPQKWIIAGIPVLFGIGAIMHFSYGLLGEKVMVGLFAPVNESIWEHSKMVLWPVILWWSLYYFFQHSKQQIDKNKWFTGALAALLISLVAMPMLYYFYTGAFGTELLLVDILILLLSLLLGQLVGLHIYSRGKGIPAGFTAAIFAVLVLVFMLFTFFPPQIPLLRDGVTGSYGIL